MKLATLAIGLLSLVAVTASAQTHVKGYTKKDGTYVAPHYRSSPNNTTLDNYSTRGNVNPYTGKEGTKDPYQNSYNSSRQEQGRQPTQSTYSQPSSNPFLENDTQKSSDTNRLYQ